MDTTSPKKRGRPAKVKPLQELHDIVDDSTTVITITEDPIRGGFPTLEPKEVIKEVLVEKIVHVQVEKKLLKDWALWKALKDAGYPQGGGGNYYEAHDSFEKAYVARPEELYSHFLGDPEAWDLLRDTLARAWLEFSMK